MHQRRVASPERLLELALDDGGDVFIGVPLHPAEVAEVLERLSHGTAEAVAYVLGARMWKGGKR